MELGGLREPSWAFECVVRGTRARCGEESIRSSVSRYELYIRIDELKNHSRVLTRMSFDYFTGLITEKYISTLNSFYGKR